MQAGIVSTLLSPPFLLGVLALAVSWGIIKAKVEALNERIDVFKQDVRDDFVAMNRRIDDVAKELSETGRGVARIEGDMRATHRRRDDPRGSE